ncbi:ABC transporter permease [Actinokineospora globicatena]|uniref:ABC transporter permease n=1 Tax=Actinokineospora globicatena TaxID=103729 RepID=A0A9W6QRA4_9PSEU|nr:ABC transporter permease [Actinokineospora globicatena]MCP2305984.1 peptide/nickel transport system permease protein [Actinokineospora globicatena]GLW80145.1 ABC transporter permease [Actinokineospora globicatena]GLW86974.1 ABC transporter permease [Actinokineospora globicatena]GLW93340.1 ABC transporter permease [Actinokineospora globicatena]
MLSFIAKRLLSGILLLIVVCSGTFFLAFVAIGDPTPGLLGNSATAAQRDALRAKIGYDRPVLTQFWDWISHAATGDFGTSWRSFQPVGDQLALRVPVTLSVVVFATLLAAVIGVAVGIACGLRPGGLLDRGLKLASVVLFALPGFWVSLVLVTWFAIELRWFPAIGYVSPEVSVSGWLSSITLPSVSLALGAIVMVGEQLRNGFLQVNNQDFVRTLRARGLSKRRVTTHVLRNASPSALTVLALMFVGLLGGAIVVEIVFNLPGIGSLTQSSSQIGDIPVLMGLTAVTVVFVVLVNFLLDLVLGWVNPKVRER